MDKKKLSKFLFEVSWEVCNPIGDIYTSLSSNVPAIQSEYGENYVAVGPWITNSLKQDDYFREEIWDLEFEERLGNGPHRVRMGRWLIPGEPKCLLVDHTHMMGSADDILAHFWQKFKLNSLFGGSDYRSQIVFGFAVGKVLEDYLYQNLLTKGLGVVVQAHEWMAASAILYICEKLHEVGTVFTTHATTLGRTLASTHGDSYLQSRLAYINSAQEAQNRGVSAKHSLEIITAKQCDCFTTLNEQGAEECRYLLGVSPQVLLPNGNFSMQLEAHQVALEKANLRLNQGGGDKFRIFSQGETVYLPFSKVPLHVRRVPVVNPTHEKIKNFVGATKRNLAWVWNPHITGAMALNSPDVWRWTSENPSKYFRHISGQEFDKVLASPLFQEETQKFVEMTNEIPSSQEIAYFCMEYGLMGTLRLYSGGLGILAGDHLKTASDLNLSLAAVGLAYKYGYFTQKISGDGRQEAHSEASAFRKLPMELVTNSSRQKLLVSIPFYQSKLFFQVWKVGVGRVPLYLLDTDVEENLDENRELTNGLYMGDSDHRLKQEYLLGVGGYFMLKMLGLLPKIYHMNEGHAAFLGVARIYDLMRSEGLDYLSALEYIRRTSVFTTHTPIPAGHDSFDSTGVQEILTPLLRDSDVEIGIWLDLGKTKGVGRFSMTNLAIKTANRVNGVSKIHGVVSQEMFRANYPGLIPNEVPVSGITNGVHPQTWVAPEWQTLWFKQISNKWFEKLTDKDLWQRALDLDPTLVWQTHRQLKQKLVSYLRKHVEEKFHQRGETPEYRAKVLAHLREETFFITFARRFAPYKRASLLLDQVQELEKILSGPYPIVFLYAGKAHPKDGIGQMIMARLLETAKKPEFAGRIVFLENYEMPMSKMLLAGSDIWLNMPLRPLEASGTSGMKAAMNGCLHVSVADGWWPEAFNGRNGWMIENEEVEMSQEFQDVYDASRFLYYLKHEILPMYFTRNENGIPLQWVQRMKESIASVTPLFSCHRMVQDYQHKFYIPALSEADQFKNQNWLKLKTLIESKKSILKNWSGLRFVDVSFDQPIGSSVTTEQRMRLDVTLEHPNLDPNLIHPQVVLFQVPEGGDPLLRATHSMKYIENSRWSVEFLIEHIGIYSMGLRVIPRIGDEDMVLDVDSETILWL